MKYLSTFSGIEAATMAWHPLGWEPVGFSEIEPFPCAVLNHHYPQVKNYGDITKFQDWPDLDFDVLVGGSPCQSFSIAGLRKGLDDPRGNLMLTFLGVAERYNPKFIVWENVPGVISDKTNALETLLDSLELLGYVVDVQVLDAQYFGLAQRRKRIFICAQNVNSLLRKKTTSSDITIAQWLTETLHSILVATSVASESEGRNSELLERHLDIVRKRIALFDIAKNRDLLVTRLLKLLELSTNAYFQGLEKSESLLRRKDAEHIVDDQSTVLLMETRFTLTEESLRIILDDLLNLQRLSTISTAISSITTYQIFIYSQAVLHIASLTQVLNQSSPGWLQMASSSLTSIQNYTNYAKQASESLFGDLERNDYWIYFRKQAGKLEELIGCHRVEDFGEVLSFADSLSWDTPPSREKRKGTAGGVEIGPSGGSLTEVNPTLDTRAKDGPIRNQLAGAVLDPFRMTAFGEYADDGSASTIKQRDHKDATDLVVTPYSIMPMNSGKDYKARETDVSQPIMAGGPTGGNQGGDYICENPLPFDTTQITSKSNYSKPKEGGPCHPLAAGAHPPAVAFAQNTRDEVREMNVVGALAAQPGMKQTSYIRQQMQVRRLTPTECERLQGFPDGFTQIPWKGKAPENCPDGPRYKALGNSMAVNVMQWIGERIELIENISL